MSLTSTDALLIAALILSALISLSAMAWAIRTKASRKVSAQPNLGAGWHEMADQEKSAYIKGMLMSLYMEGRCLREMHALGIVGPEALVRWEGRTYMLLKDALGEAAADHFRQDGEIPQGWRL